jgi:metallo-beta-lactamase family protein
MTSTPEVIFHGAAGTVTGSCTELRCGDQRILIDCGLFQGSRTLETLNREPFDFDLSAISAVVLTHAHIDHSGLLPKLVAAGFTGPIWCTAATRDLLYYMLPDAGRIQEFEAERRNRRADRADETPFEPIYTEADALSAYEQAHAVDMEHWFEAAPGIRVRLWNAGHILGSVSAEIDAGGVRLLFSGDLGPEHKAFHPDPTAPKGFDHVICESTYGDRVREHVTIEQRRDLLETEIEAALSRGGNLVIPVFALERTQELLLDIARLIEAKRLKNPRVFIDSPLASRATDVFAAHADKLEDVQDGALFRLPAFHFIASVNESIALNNVTGAIILAASGMCEAGRIRHHLLHNLPNRHSTILFVGYQAGGTLGRTLLDGADRVRMSGRDVAVRAQIRRIDSYSAHADQSDLRAWVAARAPIAGSLILDHGETTSLEALRQLMQAENAAPTIVVPQIGERYALPKDAPAKRLATGRIDLHPSIEHDWQNDYAAFSTGLKRELHAIKDAADRRAALARMREVLHSYQHHRQKQKDRQH